MLKSLSSVCWFAILFVFMFCSTSFAAEPVAGGPDSIAPSVDRAVEKVKPALVRILVVSTEYQDGREVKSESSGSGVIISPDGYVVTNHHVAGHAVRIFCTLADRKEVEAKLIGTDALSDIAVIQLEPREGGYPVAEFGDSSQLKVGDSVLAMGSPLALSQSVTLGIISNTEMVMPDFLGESGDFKLDGEDVGSIVLWLGHDAAIYPGNSGGPLVDLEGRVVGINEIDLGLSGAIPANLAKDVVKQLIEKKKVDRSWFGLEIQPQLKSAQNEGGILIAGIIKDTPAATAGFQTGDRMIRLAGQETSIRFKEELPRFNQFVAALAPGVEVEAVVVREGKEVTLKVTPVLRDEVRPKESELKEWGITASNVSFLAARERKRPSQDGILVTSVRPGGPCGESKPEVRESDIILTVNGKPVKDLPALREETKRLLEGAPAPGVQLQGQLVEGKKDPVPVLVEFERENRKYLTVVKVGIRDSEDNGREVRKPWIPIETQVLTNDLASQLGVPGKKGVRITRLFNHPSVKDSGLKEGDLILALDGKAISASEPGQTEVFPAMVRQYKTGATASLSIRRGTEELTIPVVLPEAPRPPREMKNYIDRLFEFSVRDIAFIDKAEEDWDPGQTGVLVTEVIPGGWAAVGQLNVGDLLLEVGNEPVADIEALKTRLKQIADERPKTVNLLVRRGIHQRYLELEPKWD